MSALSEIEKTLSFLPPLSEVWSEAEELAEVERRERQIESGEMQALSEAEFWRRGHA